MRKIRISSHNLKKKLNYQAKGRIWNTAAQRIPPFIGQWFMEPLPSPRHYYSVRIQQGVDCVIVWSLAQYTWNCRIFYWTVLGEEKKTHRLRFLKQDFTIYKKLPEGRRKMLTSPVSRITHFLNRSTLWDIFCTWAYPPTRGPSRNCFMIYGKESLVLISKQTSVGKTDNKHWKKIKYTFRNKGNQCLFRRTKENATLKNL